MKQKYFSLLVVAVLVANFSLIRDVKADTGVALSTPFVDVPADYDFREAIGFLKEKKIISGYPDQTFKPETTISRAEFVKIALKLSGRGSSGPLVTTKEIFNDVHKDDWFFSDVMTANKLGIAQGAGKNMFNPNSKVTRVEALKMAMNALQFQSKVLYVGDTAPSDVPQSAWFYSMVMNARRLNILTDSDNGLFYPNQEITRGAAAEILFRVQMVKSQGGRAVDVTRGWVGVEKIIPQGVGLDGVTFNIPKSWTAVKDGSRVMVLKKDPNTNLSIDSELVTPMSAKLVIKQSLRDTNESSDAYFAKIKLSSQQAYHSPVKFTSVTLMGQPTLDVNIADEGKENWYIFMPNQGLVTIYGQYGLSSLSLKLRESLRGVVRTLQTGGAAIVDSTKVDAKLLSDVQSKVLIEKAGKATIDSLGDALIMETDEIGVGTGAVDYYYSAKVQLTLKYERASDTILAVRVGKTTAF